MKLHKVSRRADTGFTEKVAFDLCLVGYKERLQRETKENAKERRQMGMTNRDKDKIYRMVYVFYF
jgi:hypothetical protein